MDFTKTQVEISFRKFSDNADDLAHSDRNTFDTHLEAFLHHCENDPVMKHITNGLKNPDTYNTWSQKYIQGGGSMAGSARLNLPVDENEKDSFLYQLLIEIRNGKVGLSGITLRCHGLEYGLDSGYQWFINQILTKLTRSLNNKLDEINDRIHSEIVGENKKVPVKMLIVFDNSISIDNSKFAGDSAIGRGSKVEKES